MDNPKNVDERIDTMKDDAMLDDDLDFIQENQFLTFSIGNETYGINILSVREIIQLLDITAVPDTLDFIKGVINLRGTIIPIMDVRMRFALEQSPPDDRTCIIVVRIDDLEMGLIVDRVEEVLEIADDNIGPMPKVEMATHHKFIKGFGKIGDDVIILLDLDKLLFEKEILELKKI